MSKHTSIHNKKKKSTSLTAPLQSSIQVSHTMLSNHDEPILYLDWHHDMEFILVTNGILQVTIEGRAFTIGEGELVFIHPHFIHSINIDSNTPCNFYTLKISTDFFHENTSKEVYDTYISPLLSKRIILPEGIPNSLSWNPQVFCILHNIALMMLTSPKEMDLLIRSKIYELIHIFYEQSDYDVYSNKNKKRKLKLSSVLDFIHEHYGDELSLKQLAQVIEVSESQLCRLFKDELGISPFSYIIRYRILESCTRLHSTNEKISSIATCIGFTNISYYNREFRTIVGCTPSEYRKYHSESPSNS